jgi:hypothetical protein
MSRRRKTTFVMIDEVKEIVDADGNRHLVKKILGNDAEGNLIVEDALGRIITIRMKKPSQIQQQPQSPRGNVVILT